MDSQSMPSWSDYLKQLETEAPIDPAPVKNTPSKRGVKARGPSAEEQAKIKAKKEEDEKRRAQMREMIKQKRGQTEPDTTTVLVSPSKGATKKVTVQTASVVVASPVKSPPKPQQAGVSPFKARSAAPAGRTALTSAKPSTAAAPTVPVPAQPAPAQPTPEVVGSPMSGGEIKDTKGNVIPAWSSYMKQLEKDGVKEEPVNFGAVPTNISTPSKIRTPAKKRPTEQEAEKLRLKKEADDKRRAEMTADIVRKKDSMKVLSPVRDQNQKAANMSLAKSAPSPIEGVLDFMRATLNSFEVQIKDKEADKHRSEIEALRRENAALKAAASSLPSASAGGQEVTAARARAVAAEARARQLEAELASTRLEMDQMSALCEELIAKLEAATQQAAGAPAAQ